MIVHEAFTQEIESLLGKDAPQFWEALEAPPVTAVRLNPDKWKQSPPTLPSVPWNTDGFYLDERPAFVLDPLFHAGTYYVQEPSSMFVEHAFRQCISETKPLRVLDLCAAPGGKSTLLASLLPTGSLLVTNEVIRSRSQILHENLLKWGHTEVIVSQNDPADFTELPGYFDLILVDAPCSGEGLFRKEPQWRSEWSPEQVQHCAARQKRILSAVWPALKTGGHLVYCTCTYNRQENDAAVHHLIAEHQAVSVNLNPSDDWRLAPMQGSAHGYRFFPHQLQGEGFFLAALQKVTDQERVRIPRIKPKHVSLKPLHEDLRSYYKASVPYNRIHEREGEQIVLDDQLLDEYQFLQRILRTLPQLGSHFTAKHTKLIPSHSLAMNRYLNHASLNSFEVDLPDALRFLSKLPLHAQPDQRGHYLVIYAGQALGWIHSLGNRSNNLYPKNYRIRKSWDVDNLPGAWWQPFKKKVSLDL